MKTINYKNNEISVDINFSIEENTVWVNQNDIVILFRKSKASISKYLAKINSYINQNPSSVSKNETVAANGKSYKMSYFNLDVIEMVGNMIDPLFTKDFITWCKEQLLELNRQELPNKSNIIRFEQDNIILDVTVEPIEDTVYLNKDQIVTLFGTTRQAIEYHIENIYESGELDKGATCKEILQVQTEGDRQVTRTFTLYNLDLVISIGFRVNSKLGVVFRNWARKVLKQYSIKGYAIDDQRIKALEDSNAYINLKLDNVIEDITKLKALNKKKEDYKSIYYNGEIFDAYDFLCRLMNEASKTILIIDPYIDEVALSILKNKKEKVKATFITTSKCSLSKIDIAKYNLQYGDISIIKINTFHDRFIILDKSSIYVLGSSLNNIGHHISTIIKLEDRDFINYLENTYRI